MMNKTANRIVMIKPTSKGKNVLGVQGSKAALAKTIFNRTSENTYLAQKLRSIVQNALVQVNYLFTILNRPYKSEDKRLEKWLKEALNNGTAMVSLGG